MKLETTDIIKELLDAKMLERWARYLAAYRAFEGNLALFDKLARCRDLREFEDAIYEAARVRDRVLEKLKDLAREVLRKKSEMSNEDVERFAEQFAEIFVVSDADLKDLVEFATKNENAPRMVGSLTASFALLHSNPEQILEWKLKKGEM